MMYIVSKNDQGLHERTWHVGEYLLFTTEAIEFVVEVQADGDELNHLHKQFDNIPFRLNSRSNRWFGDHAKFIAANL